MVTANPFHLKEATREKSTVPCKVRVMGQIHFSDTRRVFQQIRQLGIKWNLKNFVFIVLGY